MATVSKCIPSHVIEVLGAVALSRASCKPSSCSSRRVRRNPLFAVTGSWCTPARSSIYASVGNPSCCSIVATADVVSCMHFAPNRNPNGMERLK